MRHIASSRSRGQWGGRVTTYSSISTFGCSADSRNASTSRACIVSPSRSRTAASSDGLSKTRPLAQPGSPGTDRNVAIPASISRGNDVQCRLPQQDLARPEQVEHNADRDGITLRHIVISRAQQHLRPVRPPRIVQPRVAAPLAEPGRGRHPAAADRCRSRAPGVQCMHSTPCTLRSASVSTVGSLQHAVQAPHSRPGTRSGVQDCDTTSALRPRHVALRERRLLVGDEFQQTGLAFLGLPAGAQDRLADLPGVLDPLAPAAQIARQRRVVAAQIARADTSRATAPCAASRSPCWSC